MEMKSATLGMEASLSALAWRSKGYWGYEKSLMECWCEQLRVSPEFLKENIVEVAYQGEKEIGFFSINLKERELEDFWVDPDFMGQGVGRGMFQKVQEKMRELGMREITIVSDPHALGFYEKMGAIKIGETDSVPAGRKLPKLKYSLSMAEQVAGGDAPG